ncbi:MAG: CBS domain-containing protein [Deltaproteobacteria bacterium]|nr:CBS domain-containing protein [Deltaproteobacteria bacterium]
MNLDLDLFIINEQATLREALAKIESNHHGIVLSVNSEKVITGLATDGDIRRKLLEGSTLMDPISSCTNPDFVWADQATSRELLLKQLDQRIRVLPLLDSKRRLVGIISHDHIPMQVEKRTYARARSPVRISFGGGGSDLTHFFADEGGAVINTTISLYSHATLRVRDDEQIFIHSRDLGESLHAPDLPGLFSHKGKFGLVQSLLKAVHPGFGFELFLHSDFPLNSGLGGSAVVSASVLGCFNQFRQDKWDLHELAELAFQAERLYLGVAGGWQDQYATVFGGFNFMEFRMDQNIVHPLRIHPDILFELEESLILCDTGVPHDSGDIHQDQRQQMKQESTRTKVQSNVELTYRMRNHLLRGRLLQFGQCLHEAWQFKRQFSSKISNARLDNIYDNALKHGAISGKLLGAGGGGFFIFYVPPFRKHELINSLEEVGLKIRPFRFEQQGLRAWSAREVDNNHEMPDL